MSSKNRSVWLAPLCTVAWHVASTSWPELSDATAFSVTAPSATCVLSQVTEKGSLASPPTWVVST